MPHKLLLADDSVTIQRVIELTFADEDVQVLAVGDGKKAIDSIQADRPDIVLADIGMPERDGYEVAEFIKGNPQFASIPVLLLTGAFEPIDETRARAVGCDGVLVKPFEPQMVINRVKDLLAGRRPGGLWGAKPAAPPIREAPRPPAANDVSAEPAASDQGASTSASLEDYFDRLDAAFASVEAATEARSAPAGAASGAAPSRSAAGSVPSGLQPMTGSGLAADDLAGWDPDLTGDPEREVHATPMTLDAQPAVPTPATPAPPVAPALVSPAPPASAFAPVVPAPQPAAASVPLTTVQAPIETVPSPVPAPVAQTAASVAPAAAVVTMPSLADAFATLLSVEQGRPVSPSTSGPSTVSDETVEEIVRRVIARMTDQAVRETVVDVAERLVREEIEQIKQLRPR